MVNLCGFLRNNTLVNWDYLGLELSGPNGPNDNPPGPCPKSDGGMDLNGVSTIRVPRYDLACLYKKCGTPATYEVTTPIPGTETSHEEWVEDDLNKPAVSFVVSYLHGCQFPLVSCWYRAGSSSSRPVIPCRWLAVIQGSQNRCPPTPPSSVLADSIE